MREKEPFNVLEIPLEGTNMVEASAGTGKTYSIAVLVLRLLLEKKVDISRILMVTFTNKAVGELADRVRNFIKVALDYHVDKLIGIETEIKSIVDKQVGQLGEAKVEELLKEALFKLDEAPIQTIDSFAGECLNTYAFETGRQFGQELVKDYSHIVEDCVRQFWRKEITGRNDEEHAELKKFLSMNTLQKFVYQIIDGKEYYYSGHAIEKFKLEEEKYRKEWEINLKEYHKRIDDLDVKLDGVAGGTIKNVKKEFEDFYKFKKCIQLNRTIAYKTLVSHLFKKEIEFYKDWQTGWDNSAHKLFNECATIVIEEMEGFLAKKNLITYKMILDKLNEVVKANPALRDIMANRYDAIFIDEFQDTNKTQYEIYQHAFGEKNLIFFIGDPKQSIYGFRGADLFSYDEAAKGVDSVYTMEENYRSSEKMVNAMNLFFQPETDFDAFHSIAQVEKTDPVLDIHYINVTGKGKNRKAIGITNVAGEPIPPISVFTNETSENIPGKILTLVKNLLSKNFLLNGEVINPSDIGILVRQGWQGEAIKAELTGAGIKAVTINDAKIFQSREAKAVNYLLQAFDNPSRGNINRALLREFTSLQTKEIQDLDEDALTEKFRIYKCAWEDHGVYSAIRKFMDEFGVIYNLSQEEGKNGLRSLSNITQLAEVLQKAELYQELGPSGLLKFISRQISTPDVEGEEYEQRLESDEDAVQIYNIHKAKGLQFPVVIAPYLDMDDNKLYEFNTFRDPKDKNYKFYNKNLKSEKAQAHYVLQNTQENRRLIYVTLTRSQYNTFIFKTDNASSLTPFFEAQKKNGDKNFIEFKSFDLPEDAVARKIESSKVIRIALDPNGIQLKDKFWRKMSFTSLSAKGAVTPKEYSNDVLEGYERFVFKEMRRGENMGNLLHNIFENIDFTATAEDAYDEVLRVNIANYYPDNEISLLPNLKQLVTAVLGSSIKIEGQEETFALNQIREEDKIPELEFDFLTQPVRLQALKELSGLNGIIINHKPLKFNPEGILNGYVDLLFRLNDKYYILDWKSNYLGDSLEYYGKENLLRAMNENNYHLQYLIYTVAVKRFLESRIGNKFDYQRDFGGVIYMFLRGNRAGESTGVFTTKPTIEQVRKLEQLFNTEDVAV